MKLSFQPLHGTCRLIIRAAWLLMLSIWFGYSVAHARGVAQLNSEYPTALSVQIDPRTVTDDDLLQIRAAGFEFVRFGARPPIKDVNPSLVDYALVLHRVKAAKLRAIVTLFGGRRIWGESSASGSSSEGGARFATFALGLMKSHSSDVDIWEIWNEPDNDTFLDERDYERFDSAIRTLCADIKAMRSVPPIIMGFGFAKMPFVSDKVPFVLQKTAVAAAQTECITDLSVHPYTRLPETAIQSVAQLRRRLSSLNLHTSVAASEWGYSTYEPVRNGHDQAILLLREYLSSVAADIPLLNIYSWKDRGTSLFKKEDNFGIVSSSGEPKEAYFALTKLLHILRHAQKVSFAQTSHGNELEFDSKDASIRIVWTDGPAQVARVNVPASASCERLSFMNETRSKSCGDHDDGFITETIGPEPTGFLIKK